MLFNSFDFFLFFIIVTIIYYIIPSKYRWVILLISSYFFYMCWKIEYIFLIIFSTLIDYFCGIFMHRSRRILLLLSILTNLSILFFFKYWVLFSSSINSLTSYFASIPELPQLNLLLPVGVSFYTFQSMSYSIDVYNGKRKPEKHFGIFALYVCFFPQLIAGPIEKSSNLIPQFYKKVKISN